MRVDPTFLRRGDSFTNDALIVENNADAVVEVTTNERGILVVQVLPAPPGSHRDTAETPAEIADIQTG
jgi:hypothetical protein